MALALYIPGSRMDQRRGRLGPWQMAMLTRHLCRRPLEQNVVRKYPEKFFLQDCDWKIGLPIPRLRTE